MNQTETNLQRIRAYNQRVCDEWDESKHPRAANGQFGSGGGSSKNVSSSNPKESVSKAKKMLEAAFNSGWKMLGGKKSAEEMEKHLEEFWGYHKDIPDELAGEIFDLCHAAYHKGEKPSFAKCKALFDKLDKVK